jgi:hypothetical protein
MTVYYTKINTLQKKLLAMIQSEVSCLSSTQMRMIMEHSFVLRKIKQVSLLMCYALNFYYNA